jgi:putative tricarboxylic transport membrane protein
VTLLEQLAVGIEVALRGPMLFAALAGVVTGLLSAALPRMGIAALLALLLPVAQLLEAAPALALLAGFVCAVHHGLVPAPPPWRSANGSLAAPPLSSPAGQRLLALLIASLTGGVAVAVLAPSLTELAYLFGPAEYVSIALLGLIAAVVLAPGSITKSLAMLVAGLLLAQIQSLVKGGGELFGQLQSYGIVFGLLPVVLGGLSLARVVAVLGPGEPLPGGGDLRGLPVSSSRSGRWGHWQAAVRASAVGSLTGLLPGATAALAPLTADAIERGLRPHIERASGARPIDLDAAHAAAAAAARTGFVPLLALGIPLNGALALVAAMLLLHGHALGPQLMTSAPELFWGLVVSLLIAGPLLYLLGRPVAVLAQRLLSRAGAAPAIVLTGFICIALLATGGPTEIWLAAGFLLLGYLLIKLGCPVAPLLLGYVLGPVLEGHLRHALRLSDGDWGVFVTRPLSAGLLVCAGLLIAVLLLPSARSLRASTFGGAE